jgi:hypothetical protein
MMMMMMMMNVEYVTATTTTTTSSERILLPVPLIPVPNILWRDTSMATETCPFGQMFDTIIQASILNEPFLITEKNFHTGDVVQMISTNGDTIPAVSTRYTNQHHVFLERLGDSRSQQNVFRLVMSSSKGEALSSKPIKKTTNDHDDDNNRIWTFACPASECSSAQINALMQDPVKNTTWYVYSFDDENNRKITCVDVLDDTMNNDNNNNGESHLSILPRCFPASYQAWIQTLSASYGYLMLRGSMDDDNINDDDDNDDIRLFEVGEWAITMINRLPRQTSMLCASDEWLVVGYNVVEVWHRSPITNQMEWISTLLPPNHDFTFFASACTLNEEYILLAWYHDYMYDSQTILHLYKTDDILVDYQTSQTPTPVWSCMNEPFKNIEHIDRIRVLQFTKNKMVFNTTCSDQPTIDEEELLIVASHDGQVDTDGNFAQSFIQVLRIRTSVMETYSESKLPVSGSMTFGALVSQQQQQQQQTEKNNDVIMSKAVFCGKPCHMEQACAGGETIVITL